MISQQVWASLSNEERERVRSVDKIRLGEMPLWIDLRNNSRWLVANDNRSTFAKNVELLKALDSTASPEPAAIALDQQPDWAREATDFEIDGGVLRTTNDSQTIIEEETGAGPLTPVENGSTESIPPTPEVLEAKLDRRDHLDAADAAEYTAQIEPDLASIRNALLDGYYEHDPTVEDLIKRRLDAIDTELRSPTLEGADLAVIRSLVASLGLRAAPFHLHEPHGPAAERLVRVIGDDPGAEGVPARVLEEFHRDGEGFFAVQDPPLDQPSDAANEPPNTVLAADADPTLPGPVVAARAFSWLPPADDAATAVTIATGVHGLITTTIGSGVVTAAAGASVPGVLMAAGSTAIIHLSLVTLAYTWVQRNRN